MIVLANPATREGSANLTAYWPMGRVEPIEEATVDDRHCHTTGHALG